MASYEYDAMLMLNFYSTIFHNQTTIFHYAYNATLFHYHAPIFNSEVTPPQNAGSMPIKEDLQDYICVCTALSTFTGQMPDDIKGRMSLNQRFNIE